MKSVNRCKNHSLEVYNECTNHFNFHNGKGIIYLHYEGVKSNDRKRKNAFG